MYRNVNGRLKDIQKFKRDTLWFNDTFENENMGFNVLSAILELLLLLHVII